MADEKIFTIPLRKEWLKAPDYKRTKKAVKATKEFIARHMKNENVKIGPALNEQLWSQGNKHPPHKVKVKSKIDDGKALVELVDVPFQVKQVEEKKTSLKDKILAKKEDKAPAASKKTTETKEVQKEKAAEATKDQKAAAKPVPGTPDKTHTPTKEEQKLQKTKRVIPQHGKKDASAPKP